jgi:hypothetical protein
MTYRAEATSDMHRRRPTKSLAAIVRTVAVIANVSNDSPDVHGYPLVALHLVGSSNSPLGDRTNNRALHQSV